MCAWLPGRELLRISASSSARSGIGAFRFDYPAGIRELIREPQRLTELVQWMLQDASLLPRGLKLI
jgi:hypothetical protein